MMMQPIRFELETVTPMFLAGYQQSNAEFRPPSLKGMLRFWWRAYYWGSQTGPISKEELSRREGEIFGTSANTGKKSPFSVRFHHQNVSSTKKTWLTSNDAELNNDKYWVEVPTHQGPREVHVLNYLAWPHSGSEFKRPYFPAKSQLSVTLTINDIKWTEEILKSFYFWCVFGALGSKSRNGFGNVRVGTPEFFLSGCPDFFQGCQIEEIYPMPSAKLLKWINYDYDVDSYPAYPPFAAFSQKMCIFKTSETRARWDVCLADLGLTYFKSKSKLSAQNKRYIGFAENQKRLSKPYFLRVIPEKDQLRGYIFYLSSAYCLNPQKETECQKARQEFNNHLQQIGKMEVIP